MLARLLSVVCSLAILAASTGCGRQREPLRPRHVFLVTVDTLRADHLGTYGYGRDTSPYLDRLAKQSVLFERAIVQWPKTGVSFASMFTGQYPHTTGLTHKSAIRIPEGFLTLPELFESRGFTTVGVNSNGVLSDDLGWNRGFDEYLETGNFFSFQEGDQRSYRASMNARRVNELAFPLLEKHQGADRLFAWIHYSDPHTPYFLPPDVANPFLDDRLFVGDQRVLLEQPGATEIDGRQDLKFYVSQYDANVLVVDRAIEQLIGQLDKLGLLADSVVIVTADHGESLGEHEYYLEHGRLPYNTTSHVPLLVYEPYRPGAGRRVPEPVELVGLYPTLRDLVAPGVEVAGLEGKSWLPFLRGDQRALARAGEAFRYAFSAAGGGNPLTHFRSVQEQGWKLVFHPPLPTRKGERPIRWELYRLSQDPLETEDLIAVHRGEADRLRPVLEAWMNGRLWIYPPKGLTVQRSQEVEKALKALGYVE